MHIIAVLFKRVQVDEDIIQIYNYEDVTHIVEDVIHEVLEGCRGVGHSKGHDKIFEESIAGVEGSFPFIS